MAGEDGATVSIDSIYAVLVGVRDEVKTQSAELRALTVEVREARSVDADHEHRIRELESTGGTHAQEAAAEISKIRERLHGLEGSALLASSFIKEQQNATTELRAALEKLQQSVSAALEKLQQSLTDAQTYITGAQAVDKKGADRWARAAAAASLITALATLIYLLAR